jgi:transcription elongation factor Elf1
MMIPDLKTMEQRLTALPCPICKQTAFAIPPRAQESYTEQMYKARCLKCAYMFPVNVPTKPLQMTDPDTANWLAGLPCPACRETGTRLDFRCMLNVRESVVFVTCTACHHPFTEKAPMEAYE